MSILELRSVVISDQIVVRSTLFYLRKAGGDLVHNRCCMGKTGFEFNELDVECIGKFCAHLADEGHVALVSNL